MKLYNGFSPNGVRVDIFLAEKGVDLPVQMVDVMAGETQTEEYLKRNSLGHVPVLELDNGTHITESIAICRYLESLHPEPSLFGNAPEEAAIIEMWTRRLELWLFNVAGDIGLHEFEYFKYRVEQVPEYAATQRRQILKRLSWLDGEMADGRAYIAGENFSIADIVGMSMLVILGFVGVEVPANLENFNRWAMNVTSRPSFPELPSAPPAEQKAG